MPAVTLWIRNQKPREVRLPAIPHIGESVSTSDAGLALARIYDVEWKLLDNGGVIIHVYAK